MCGVESRLDVMNGVTVSEGRAGRNGPTREALRSRPPRRRRPRILPVWCFLLNRLFHLTATFRLFCHPADSSNCDGSVEVNSAAVYDGLPGRFGHA
jgi:hypothetical protein